jgi:hypothetical protein
VRRVLRGPGGVRLRIYIDEQWRHDFFINLFSVSVDGSLYSQRICSEFQTQDEALVTKQPLHRWDSAVLPTKCDLRWSDPTETKTSQDTHTKVRATTHYRHHYNRGPGVLNPSRGSISIQLGSVVETGSLACFFGAEWFSHASGVLPSNQVNVTS